MTAIIRSFSGISQRIIHNAYSKISDQQKLHEIFKSRNQQTASTKKFQITPYEPVKIPLGEKEVFINSERLCGVWKDKFSQLPLIPFDTSATLWGKFGRSAYENLERQLQFKFDSETRSFIEEIGNLTLQGSEILIAGDVNEIYNCVTQSRDLGLKVCSKNGVKIMDTAGLSYLLYEDGSIKSYETAHFNPEEVIESYDSLFSLIKNLFKELILLK